MESSRHHFSSRSGPYGGHTEGDSNQSQIQKLKGSMNKYEWVPALDKALQEIVLRNYFNFDMVSLELNEETRRLGLNFGATHVFTNEKCRIRWSYLHLKRQAGKQVKYKDLNQASPKKQEETKTASTLLPRKAQKKDQPKVNRSSSGSTTGASSINEPQQSLNEKSFDSMISINKEKVTLGNLESELWKKNIIQGARRNKDYLDVSTEDFTKNTSLSIDGREITPSNFNIFRDSLRFQSEQLLKTLNENLPDMNLKEIEEEEHRRMTDREDGGSDQELDDDDEEVLPLDFRTALIENENKVVIQAKPLSLKTEEELMREAIDARAIQQSDQFETMESYLEAVKKEPFKQEEGNVILIDPDINIKEKFEAIDLACNKEQRINNTFNAPLRTREQQQALAQMLVKEQAKMQAPKLASKQYDTDTDNNTDTEQQSTRGGPLGMPSNPMNLSADSMPHGFRKENLDFNNILKQWGVSDLNKMIGCPSTSEDEKGKKKTKGDDQREVGKRVGLIESIMNENRQAQQQRSQAESQPLSMDAMLDALRDEAQTLNQYQQQSGEDSDIAPMSALVDTPTKEELKQQELRKAQKSVKLASSASEDEHYHEKKAGKQKKHVTFSDQQQQKEKVIEETKEEVEMIDTSSKKPEPAAKKKKKKVLTYKGIKIQSDNEEDEEEEDGSKKKSETSSNDSAEEYFNQQRKLIKKRLLGSKDMQGQFEKDDYASVNEDEIDTTGNRRWDDDEEGSGLNADMSEFDRMMQQSMVEASKVQEEEQKKARDEQERLRVERLKQQEENLKREQEKKQKERDELMEKLKKQDEERKKRKKEEKAKKEQEREIKKRLDEEKLAREAEEKERLAEVERKKKQEEERIKREKEENERRKDNFERSIKKIWNGSDIPCLFESKIAYSNLLYSLPADLEDRILKNEVPNEDLVFRRYKVLLIPLDSLLSRTSGLQLIEIINYFLRYSTMKKVQNNEESEAKLKTFPFKCIGVVQSVAVPPFNKCSLSAVSPQEQPNAQRVLTLLFDTHDKPQSKVNFNEALKVTKLTDILSEQSMQELSQVYGSYLEKLASDYLQANKLKEFPYAINAKASPLIEFENQGDLKFDSSPESAETLSRIGFFMEYSLQDDIVPMTTKESWEFLRRYPTFYAYNPNSRSYSRIDSRDKIRTKYNQYKSENVCVIFKDISFGRVTDAPEYHESGAHSFTQKTKCNDSLTFFLKKATVEGGLEICGMRMIYMDKDQIALYEHLFNEKLHPKNQETLRSTSLFAFFLRGIDAISKCEQIVGHFNPEMARKTNEKSVRAFFGRDKDQQNCVLKMFSSEKKNLSELIFWFGGRVQQESPALELTQTQSQVPISTMYLVVPPKTEKQFLFLSPYITTRELPHVLSILCEFGVSILDIQKINYERLQYEGEGIQTSLNRDLCLFRIRGSTYQIPVGFVIKVAREGIQQKYLGKLHSRLDKALGHLPRANGGLIYMTQTLKEYKIVRQKVRQTIFNVNYQQLQLDHLKPKSKVNGQGESGANRTDYDSEDTENYREISLFNFDPKMVQLGAAGKGGLKKPAATLTTSVGSKKAPDSYETSTFLCFLKVSVFRKQIIRDVLSQILSQQTQFELIGIKLINAKREIYNELVPVEIRTLFKKLAFKFYESYPDLRLRKKITEFKTLALVLRGRNVENSIGKIYDRERLKFLNNDATAYEGSPQGLFLTNNVLLDPLFTFLLSSKMIKLYNDFALSHEHLMDSPIYSYMLNHNVERVDPTILARISDPAVAENLVTVSNIVLIKHKEQLFETQTEEGNQGMGGKLSACICVVKPNQPLNVALRTLKSIANNKDLGLSIQNIEITKYDERQVELLYKHDIEFDELIPEHLKPQMKEQFIQLFKGTKNPVVQFLVSGPYAISKIKQIIGNRDPKLAAKDSMRSFYGQDRVDNAYFISENFSESLIERDYLFSQANQLTPASLQALAETQTKKIIKSLHPIQPVNTLHLGVSHQQELALILFSPTIVASNDFVFVLDDLQRSKFNICALLRLPATQTLEREDLEILFQEAVPRMFNLEALETLEFKKEGGCVFAVVEKEKAVQELNELVGRLEIKSKNDIEKYKKKQSSAASSSMMFGSYQNEQQSLIQEYGPYIFTFPIGGHQANQRKIARYFSSLPNSHHFEIVSE